ncbi:serine/threonine protein kinase [Wenzhouxiangella marina]|uniref:Protein kinase domain-containing protein n=1 Tax=Wenzhouxiangella marina TaxID=1579979 RepID=A0A0K0XYW1_9GAMM|nr:serine/threonine-protein kinase [Wenzhouxiangella marina]AKS42811.1 hypothetical protein WM2015_2450 [Wenzhouxiangella marina]MBB6087510.1 putative Ser/Thr protein kinase [Wenzhouxiangella marina]
MSNEAETQALTLALNRALHDSAQALGPGSVLGHFIIERVLGQGGMGVVYQAEQIEPVRRKVAIKLSRQRRLSAQERAWFELERQALAQMNHPAIAQILEADALEDASPYFVMEYVDGETLLKHVDARQSSLRERIELMIQVGRGVEHAHQKGVLHCDLKPSNILVRDLDGRAAPKIIDFGTARLAGQASNDGQIYGTAAYMAPEQAEVGQVIDTRTDLFSLGLIGLEMLSGRSARPDAHTGDPTNLSEIRSLLGKTIDVDLTSAGPAKGLSGWRRRELEAILARAIRQDPAERYDSVAEFVQDLQRWLDRQPVSALPASRAYRARLFLTRNALAVGLGGLTLIGLAGGLVATSLSLNEAESQRRLAEARQADLERVVEFQQNLLSEIDMNDLAARLTGRLSDTAGQLVRRDGGSESEADAATLDARSMIERLAPVDAARDLVVEGILGQADALISERHADNPAIEASLRLSLGQTLVAWQAFDAADAQIEAARAYYRRIDDWTSRDALEAETEALKLRWWLQRFPEAYALAQATRPRAEAALGLDDDLSLYLLRAETALSSYIEGAAVAMNNGRKLVERLTRLRGPSHPDTLRAEGDQLFNRIHGSGSQRCDDGLVADFHDHLARAESLSGSDRRTLAVSSMNLGTCLALNGQYADAAHWMGRAAELGREVLGERHGITMQALNDRANYLLLVGRLDEAEDVVDSLYEHQRAIYGEASHYLFYPRSYKLYLAGATGQADAAIDGMNALITEASQNAETTIAFLNWLHHIASWIHEASGRLDEALRMAEAGLALCQSSQAAQAAPEVCGFNELEATRLQALQGQTVDPARLNELLEQSRSLYPTHYARSLAAWLVYRFGQPTGPRESLRREELDWLLEEEPARISIIQQRIVDDLRANG